jgi:hypothetical protein
MLDSYEDTDHPWLLCKSAAKCPQGVFVDHLSATLVNKKHPMLYPGASVVGLVLSPIVPIWCAFAGDAGSGVGVHGNCGDRTKWSLEHELIWGETHSKGVTGYNEVIVGRDDYESRLPQAVEAVVFTGDDRSKAEAVHAKFLGAYGLAASQVPLLHVAPVKAWYTQWGIESFEET